MYEKVPMSLTQLVRTMHNICKVRDLNPDHHKKKEMYEKNVSTKVNVFDSNFKFNISNFVHLIFSYIFFGHIFSYI